MKYQAGGSGEGGQPASEGWGGVDGAVERLHDGRERKERAGGAWRSG